MPLLDTDAMAQSLTEFDMQPPEIVRREARIVMVRFRLAQTKRFRISVFLSPLAAELSRDRINQFVVFPEREWLPKYSCRAPGL
jgi:hypothetical protein